MQLINRALATCQFEIQRAISIQRVSVATVLTLFPPVMLLLLISASTMGGGSNFDITEFIILFLVSLVCILSLLLWATPNVYSELEGKSWIFIASRPQGRISNVLGKYLASVIFSYAICFVSCTLCVVIASMVQYVVDPVRLWIGLNGVFLLGCTCYAAVFSLIGTIFYRRAMVIGAAYVLGFEVFVGRVPAIIGKLTVSHHLQNIGLEWIGSEQLKSQIRDLELFGRSLDASISLNIFAIGLITVLALGAACFIIMNREYVTSDET